MEEKAYKIAYQSAYQAAYQQGLELGRLDAIYEAVAEGDYGIDRGMELAGLTREEFIEDMKKNGYKIPKIEYADGD